MCAGACGGDHVHDEVAAPLVRLIKLGADSGTLKAPVSAWVCPAKMRSARLCHGLRPRRGTERLTTDAFGKAQPRSHRRLLFDTRL
jgi:hypothetical protein